jgi:uncharacterized phage infection (PIP) family protein YhgE
MVSSKERLRIERWINDLLERIKRQQSALDRLSAAMVEAVSALHEIKDMDALDSLLKAQARAQQALDDIAAMTAAAAKARSEAESISVQDPNKSEESDGTR